MKINAVNLTVSDYSTLFERNEVQIDRTYQRSPDVWPNAARSYLIETILKGFPIPKLAIHQLTDLKSRRTIKYVVDGQQRTMAILDFYSDRLRLSGRLGLADAAGHTYSELPEELQQAFLGYQLNFDQFEAATDETVREYFRRINSFTAPLNAEEQRHARFQGPMKWFIVSLSQLYGDRFVDLRVLPKNRVIRMADSKLLAEIVHALLNGVSTTSKAVLDKMYETHDKGDRVDDETTIRDAVNEAVETILEWREIHPTSLTRMNVFYSLILAVIRVRFAWPTLRTLVVHPERPSEVAPGAVENLLALAAALDDPEAHPRYDEFVRAAAEKTNVKAQRETRVRWLVRALTDTL